MTFTENIWTHGYINTNGIKLHYVTQGEGRLMLLMHGFPDFCYSWRAQITEFATDFQVVAIDLRGYNDSDKPKEQSAYVMSEFIQDLEGVIKGLGYDTCILVGHDWGGAIAWHFAYAHPEMVEKLIVLNFPHPAKFAEGLRTPQQLKRSSYIFFFQLPILPELTLQANDYSVLAQAFAGTINPNAFSSADIEAYKDAAAKRGALTAMLNYYRNLFNQDLNANWPVFRSNWPILEVSTLLIWGEQDIALGKELTYGTQEYVRDCQIKYIANAGHWVAQEQPELVNQCMRDFVS
jgi:pimeloyl-ACP methyl ester carboxylesterase